MGTNAYDKANTRRVNIKLNNNTDADIIEILEEHKNAEGIQGYFKMLVRADNSKAASGCKPYRISAGKYGCGICGTELYTKQQRYCGNCGQPILWAK